MQPIEKVKKRRYLSFYLLMMFGLYNYSFCVNAQSSQRYVARVDKHQEQAFSTITQAINAAPDNLTQPYTIKIAAGDYYEKITVTKPFIRLQGEGSNNTRLYFDDYAGRASKNNSTMGTTKSATLTIQAHNFSAHNLHIENSFDFPYYDALSDNDPARVSGMQAVAVLTDKGSDKALFQDVKISGFQDTLYTKTGRSLFLNCQISGHIDFIFGGGTAVFYKSDIVTRHRPNKMPPIGYITAPSTNMKHDFGLVFIDSILSREVGVKDQSMGLGRPWHPTTSFEDGRYADPNAIGQTVFINTWMGAHIQAKPWHPMGGTAKSGEKIMFSPDEARFFEYNSLGPGALESDNRRKMSQANAQDFVWEKILGDWYQTPRIRKAIKRTSMGKLVIDLPH